jgi:hypothetical protein
VVSVAEKEGKHVSLLVVPGSNVFDTILLTAQRLQSSRVVTGFSEKLSPDQQGKLTGDAWERLPEPKPRLTLQLIRKDGGVTEYQLGPHEPRLRPEDMALLHQLWLEITSEPQMSGLHHYDLVAIALEKLRDDLSGEEREKILNAMLEKAAASAHPKLKIPRSRVN